MKNMIRSLALIVCFFGVASCDPLPFGENLELSGAAFDSTKLADLSKKTGISFPPGSKGVGYLYLGSGIDPALEAKILIPKEQKEEFLKNQVFVSGSKEKGTTEIGKGKHWWHRDQLSEREDRTMSLPQAQFLEVSAGTEGSDYYVYVSWITT